MTENKNVLEIKVGIPIKDAAQLAIDLAKQRYSIPSLRKNSTIILKYGEVEIEVSPKTKPEYVVNAFFSKAASLPNMGMQQPKQKAMGM